VADGAVYVGSYDHLVYAFGPVSGAEENGTLPTAIPLGLITVIVGAVILAVVLVGILLHRRKHEATY
jgi:hypothetical protein